MVSNGCQSTFGTCNTTAAEPQDTGAGDSVGSGGECGAGKGSCIESECCSLAGFCGVGPGRKIFSICP